MSQPVTVTHGGVEITTNTVSEADLRTEMGAPAAVPAGAPAGGDVPADSAPPPEAPAAPAPPVRDEKGRFTRAEADTPPAELPDPTLPLEPPGPTEGEARPPSESPRHSPIARMNRALRQKAEAERRAAALEAELARLRGTPGTPPAGNG